MTHILLFLHSGGGCLQSNSQHKTDPLPHMSIAVAPEVADTLALGGAVVALESTIIFHGQLPSTHSYSCFSTDPLPHMSIAVAPKVVDTLALRFSLDFRGGSTGG